MARAQARKSSASRSRAATRAVVSRAHAQSGRSSTYRGATCANKRRSTPVLDGLQARHELRRREPPLPERRLDARLDELAELVVQRRVLVRELRVVAGGERGGGAPLEPRRVLAEGPRGLGFALVAVAAVAVVVLQQVLELVDDVDDQLDLLFCSSFACDWTRTQSSASSSSSSSSRGGITEQKLARRGCPVPEAGRKLSLLNSSKCLNSAATP